MSNPPRPRIARPRARRDCLDPAGEGRLRATAMAWRKSPPELIATFERVVPAGGAERRLMFGYPAAFVNGKMFCRPGRGSRSAAARRGGHRRREAGRRARL